MYDFFLRNSRCSEQCSQTYSMITYQCVHLGIILDLTSFVLFKFYFMVLSRIYDHIFFYLGPKFAPDNFFLNVSPFAFASLSYSLDLKFQTVWGLPKVSTHVQSYSPSSFECVVLLR